MAGFLTRFNIFSLLATVSVGYVGNILAQNSDFLNGFSSAAVVQGWQIQAGLFGFCLSPSMEQVRATVVKGNKEMGYSSEQFERSFEETGGINEDDYDKSSIYSILYSVYRDIGEKLQPADKNGEDTGTGSYEFTFNTWGVAPSDFGETDPQRHGKTSYAWFRKSKTVQEMVAKADKEGRPLRIVEVGCGTGAGANLLSTEVFPNSHYTAIDMQMSAIKTCERRHASAKLDCVHLPEGVGNHGGYTPTNKDEKIERDVDTLSNTYTPDRLRDAQNKGFGQGQIPLEASSVDFAIILETHIAEQKIGPEEKSIFAEIKRVLKPGGLFMWGNAIPTDVWFAAEEYLPTAGFDRVDRWNNTGGAITARDEDHARVNLVMQGIRDQYSSFDWLDTAMFNPFAGAGDERRGTRCFGVVDKLVRNFFRDVGTSLYITMVDGMDSYMHYVFKVTK